MPRSAFMPRADLHPVFRKPPQPTPFRPSSLRVGNSGTALCCPKMELLPLYRRVEWKADARASPYALQGEALQTHCRCSSSKAELMNLKNAACPARQEGDV